MTLEHTSLHWNLQASVFCICRSDNVCLHCGFPLNFYHATTSGMYCIVFQLMVKKEEKREAEFSVYFGF